MALVLLLCDLRDGEETRERRGGGEVSRRRAPRLPLVACAVRAVRARASCHEQVGVFWCNWIVVNALNTTPCVRRVARRLRPDPYAADKICVRFSNADLGTIRRLGPQWREPYARWVNKLPAAARKAANDVAVGDGFYSSVEELISAAARAADIPAAP
jgi:hypothetical protein